MGKPLVLVVDDEPDMANYIAKVVKSTEKYEVAIAYNGKEALAALEKHRHLFGLGDTKVGCVILDIKMPEMDGLQFLEKLRKDYEGRIGVIILSAYEDQEKRTKAYQGKVVAYLTKPFEDKNLLDYLELFFTTPGFAIDSTKQVIVGKNLYTSITGKPYPRDEAKKD
jgi:CheY-like chemotaxis protein